MNEQEVEAVKKVIEEAYMEGIHVTQDQKTVLKGFHKDFNMLVLNDNELQKVSLNDWFGRIERMKTDNPEMWRGESRHNFLFVDVVGKAAVAKLDVFKNNEYFSTDYMLLYKYEDSWKIVSKIFTT